MGTVDELLAQVVELAKTQDYDAISSLGTSCFKHDLDDWTTVLDMIEDALGEGDAWWAW